MTRDGLNRYRNVLIERPWWDCPPGFLFAIALLLLVATGCMYAVFAWGI